MSGRKITYYSLVAFLIGAAILTYVQYDSTKNIDALIGGNQALLNEFAISNQLKTLEKDVLTVESQTRGHITTGNAELSEGVQLKLREITKKVDQLHKDIDDTESRKHLTLLDSLIDRKLRWNQNLYNTYYQHGRDSAVNLIKTQRGRHLTDSIAQTIAAIDTTRHEYMRNATDSVDNNSEIAKRHNLILVISLLIGAAIFFWYTVNSARKQSKLIHELNISERKVKESALIKERFLANMSHEIRTPLNAILGFINLLLKKPLDKESADYVDTIRRSGENLLNIVNDILDLSKIEARMMHIESAPFSLRGLIHSVQNMFSSKSLEKDVTVTAEIDSSIPDILEGDATKLTQILVNLIGNALKFTHGGSITVRVTNEGMENGFLRTGIAISDTGIGIEADKLEHIFERFRQAEDSVNRHYGGTGLGLTIVNELVSMQKGTISVDSEVGKGTTFRVMIPYKVADLQDSESLSRQAALPATDFTAIKLLVAEDNEINQKLIRHLFKNWGLAYDMVSNGSEAIEALKRNSYDMILMDIQMPEMDGYTASQNIREQLNISTPIIAMTAHAFAGEREKCLSYGMNDYISKPIKEDKLHDLIAKFARVMPVTTPAQPSAASEENFHFISLGYLKEISGGDAEYEKSIMAVFLEQLPKEIAALENAWESRNMPTVKKVVHHLKTTISVVGLNDNLQPVMDAVEYNELGEETVGAHINSIVDTCRGALKEAETFQNNLQKSESDSGI